MSGVILLGILFCELVVLLTWMILTARSQYGSSRFIHGPLFKKAKTLAALSDFGPKVLYLSDFEFTLNKSEKECYLHIDKLTNGEDMDLWFREKDLVNTLDVFYKWYERNREDISKAIEETKTSGPRKKLKHLK